MRGINTEDPISLSLNYQLTQLYSPNWRNNGARISASIKRNVQNKRGLKSKCTQSCFIIRSGNRLIQALDDQLLAFALGSCLNLVINSHQTGVTPTKRKKYLILLICITVSNLRYMPFFNDLTGRTAWGFLHLFIVIMFISAHWCLLSPSRNICIQYKTSASALPSRRGI